MSTSPFLSLEKFPDSNDTHLWADYVELRCLTDLDLMISKAEIQAYVRKRQDLQKGFGDYACDDDDLEPEDQYIKLASDVRRAAQAEDLFKHLEYRVAAFDNFYPFSLSRDGDILRRRTRVASRHKLYVFFLLASNLGHIIGRRYRDAFTDAFEVASMAALKRYLPNGAKIHIFGTNSLNKGRYSGQLLKKCKQLAEDLGERFVGKEVEFSPSDHGDNGLDLAGWIPFGDNLRGFLLVFGQCACSYEEWPTKQHSSAVSHWRNIITFMTPPCNMTFIPFFYRRNTGEWHMERKIDDSILVDRLRLITLLKDSYPSLKELPYNLINKAIAQRNPLA